MPITQQVGCGREQIALEPLHGFDIGTGGQTYENVLNEILDVILRNPSALEEAPQRRGKPRRQGRDDLRGRGTRSGFIGRGR